MIITDVITDDQHLIGPVLRVHRSDIDDKDDIDNMAMTMMISTS